MSLKNSYSKMVQKQSTIKSKELCCLNYKVSEKIKLNKTIN